MIIRGVVHIGLLYFRVYIRTCVACVICVTASHLANHKPMNIKYPMRKLILNLTGYSILSRAEIQALRKSALTNGKEIGQLDVLKFNQATLSTPKFKESAAHFHFQNLMLKYPTNPLLEKPHESKTPTQGITS